MTRKNTRRDFLRGKAAADALAEAAQSALGSAAEGSLGPNATGGYVVRVGRRAMACEFEVCLNAGQYPHGTQAALNALDLVETLEEQLSYFRETSELSRINRLAGREPQVVEPRLFALLELAMRVHAETEGAFDLTATALWEAWGFARRAGSVPSQEALADALAHVGSQFVELDPTHRTIRLLRAGVRLNLGALGKGYALDHCAEVLLQAGVGDFLLHGGFSSMVARGAAAGAGNLGDQDAPGWTVALVHPLRPQRQLAEIRLRNQALSTSGCQAQSFRYRGHRYGHIIDPRTGRPAENVLSATVVAPTATLAEALSTALLIMGPDTAKEFCQSRPELGAVLICPARQRGGIEVHASGLSDRQLKFL